MAIATATCTCATCGNTFEVRARKQNRRDADAWEIWAAEHMDECTDCYKARMQRERDEEKKQAAEAAAELGWPDLTGSDKQISWANTIRDKIIGIITDKLDYTVELEKIMEGKGKDREESDDCLDYVSSDTIRAVRDWLLTTKTRASDWIDIRDYIPSVSKAIWERKWIAAWKLQGEPVGEEEIAQAEATRAEENAAATLRPQEQTHQGVAVIDVSRNVITVSIRKDDDFRALVKSLGYKWNPEQRYWYKQVDTRRDSVKERAAELGNKLLAAGFAVRIADPEVRQAAVAGDYEPETFRWIDARDADFFITWARDDDFYAQAKRLPRARYSKPGILVPAAEWEEVKDFAHTHGFRFTPAAQELLDRQSGAVLVVEPAAPKEPVYDEHDPGEILQSPAEVLGDLIDDA